MWLWLEANQNLVTEPVLHFAPEKVFQPIFRIKFHNYRTADLFRSDVDLNLNIENIDLPCDSIGTIICNHVLEHVDDIKAISEIYRVLSPSGIAIISTPLIEGWDKTYEIEGMTDELMRTIHFGQKDHVRFYGRDLRERLKKPGFKIEEITSHGSDVAKYGLLRGEKIFICIK